QGADGDTGTLGERPGGERNLDILLHVLEDSRQWRVAVSGEQTWLGALRLGFDAWPVCDEGIGNDLGKCRAMPLADQAEHEIERRVAAGAGDAVIVNLIETFTDLDTRVTLFESRYRLPMHGDFAAMEHPRFGERECPCIDAAHGAAMARQAPQPVEE